MPQSYSAVRMRERSYFRHRTNDAQTTQRYHELRESGAIVSAKYFSRFDTLTKDVFISACEAAVTLGAEALQDAALLLVSRAGSEATNRAFFEDYLANGKTLARGNLFIYTLPTSPLAEIAIHLGIRGPLVYCASNESSQDTARKAAFLALRDGSAAVLAFVVEEDTIQTIYCSR